MLGFTDVVHVLDELGEGCFSTLGESDEGWDSPCGRLRGRT